MGSKMEACAECSRSCSSLHRTKLDPYPIVSSFFKIMFGKQFSELLVVPPKFAKTVSALVGKNTYLEDQTGQKWKVNLSYVDGSLAFQQGWHEFSVDHAIKLGDFLVFHYFKGSHFAVHIYGRSGCEKPIIFSDKNYQNKRAKLATDFIYENPCDSSDKESPAKECSDSCINPVPDVNATQRNVVSKVEKAPEIGVNGNAREQETSKQPSVVPATDILVESCLMTNNNGSFSREDDRRNDLLDLSIFEMPEMKSDAGNMSLQEIQAQVAALDVDNGEMAKDTLKTSNEADWSRKEIVLLPDDDVSSANIPLNIIAPLKPITFPYRPEFSAPAASCQTPCGRMRIAKQEPKSAQNVCNNVVADNNYARDGAIVCTSKDHNVKNNKLGWHPTPVIEYKGQRGMVVSPEAPKLCDSSTLHSNITYLELPRPLPVKACNQGIASSEQSLVLLRDPVGRLWPVMYHQKKGVKALACGWKEFRRANSIRPGDQCAFVVENIDECIFQVHIFSKFLSHQTSVNKLS